MTPKQLAELITRTALQGVREGIDLATFRGRFESDEDRDAWAELLRQVPDFLQSIDVKEVDTDADYVADDLPPVGDEFRVVLRKEKFEGVVSILLSRSFRTIIESRDRIEEFETVAIADLDPESAFATYSQRFVPWDNVKLEAFEGRAPLPDPRALVTDFLDPTFVPADLRHWLAVDLPPKIANEFVDDWRGLAAQRVMAAIVDRVSSLEGSPQFHLQGPPTVSFCLSEQVARRLYDTLNSAGQWVYAGEPRDIDARHMLLANEIARAFRHGGFDNLDAQCLESAKSAYVAYIKSKSAEALKALSALRQSVLSETKEITERALGFARAMWKDLAIASAPFVVKVIVDASTTENSQIAKGLCFAAAGFLIFSVGAQWFLNERWLCHQKKARGVWQLDINTALTADEMKKIADDPIARSVFDYRAIGVVVTAIYLAIAWVLWQYGQGALSL